MAVPYTLLSLYLWCFGFAAIFYFSHTEAIINLKIKTPQIPPPSKLPFNLNTKLEFNSILLKKEQDSFEDIERYPFTKRCINEHISILREYEYNLKKKSDFEVSNLDPNYIDLQLLSLQYLKGIFHCFTNLEAQEISVDSNLIHFNTKIKSSLNLERKIMGDLLFLFEKHLDPYLFISYLFNNFLSQLEEKLIKEFDATFVGVIGGEYAFKNTCKSLLHSYVKRFVRHSKLQINSFPNYNSRLTQLTNSHLNSLRQNLTSRINNRFFEGQDFSHSLKIIERAEYKRFFKLQLKSILIRLAIMSFNYLLNHYQQQHNFPLKIDFN